MKRNNILRIVCLILLVLPGGCTFLEKPPDNAANPMSGVGDFFKSGTSSQTSGGSQSGSLLSSTPLLNPPQFDATLSIDTATKKGVNRKVLGNNIQWVDHGDDLLDFGTLNLNVDKLNRAKTMGVTALRYPGGSLSDLYHFRDGLGPIGSRGRNQRFEALTDDVVLMGTVEFLTFARLVGAEPIITVNIPTGTPQEAADWVTLINVTGLTDPGGNPLPKVKYWEIGNEPYLIGAVRPGLALQPKDFALKANDTIKAMKAVDPSIMVGIPLRSDTLAGTPATPFQGYNDAVLADMVEPFDFVALHNAYFPAIAGPPPSVTSMYRAIMSARQYVKADIDATKAILTKHFPGQNFPVAITEYNALFTIGQGSTDGLIASLIGALYVADLLTLFATTDEVLMANLWSLAGNFFFGAIRSDGKLRPTYHVFEGFNRVLTGQVLASQITSPLFKGAKAGFIPANDGLPAMSAVVTQTGTTLRAFVVNKHLDEEGRLTLDLGGLRLKSLKIQTLTSNKFIPDDVSITGWSLFKTLSPDQPVNISPHTMAILEMELN